jgi:hypothetical protein
MSCARRCIMRTVVSRNKLQNLHELHKGVMSLARRLAEWPYKWRPMLYLYVCINWLVDYHEGYSESKLH